LKSLLLKIINGQSFQLNYSFLYLTLLLLLKANTSTFLEVAGVKASIKKFSSLTFRPLN